MAKQSPSVHPKNAATGKGVTPKTPGNSGKAKGPSNHVPATGLMSQQQQ
jgi:hypothetical protein